MRWIIGIAVVVVIWLVTLSLFRINKTKDDQ